MHSNGRVRLHITFWQLNPLMCISATSPYCFMLGPRASGDVSRSAGREGEGATRGCGYVQKSRLGVEKLEAQSGVLQSTPATEYRNQPGSANPRHVSAHPGLPCTIGGLGLVQYKQRFRHHAKGIGGSTPHPLRAKISHAASRRRAALWGHPVPVRFWPPSAL